MPPRMLIADRYDVAFHARGGMGEVWFGHDLRLDREVAVKIIRFPGGERDAEFEKRFHRESRITARLQHPGVPAVYDFGEHDNRLFLVMQRVHGAVLTDVIGERGRLAVGWAAAIAAQICSVLAAAHAASLVHRDLKPSNIMLESYGGVKVLDFGVAAAPTWADSSRITHSGQQVGTPGYMAPEQIAIEISGPRSDLYALGVTLHEMLAGERLFTAPTQFQLMNLHVTEPPPPLRPLREQVPVELERLVLDLLAKKPEDRPASADVVYRRLLPFVGDLGPIPGMLHPPATPSPERMYGLVLGRVFADPPAARPTPPAPTPTAAASLAGPPAPRSGTAARPDLARARDEAAALARQSRFAQAASALAASLAAAAAPGSAALDPITLELRRDLAGYLFEAGDYRRAAPEFGRLAADLAQRDGPTSEAALACRQKEATCHALIGDTGAALSELDGLLTDSSRVFGADDPRATDLLRQIALLQLGTGEREAARATLRRLAGILTTRDGPDHSAVAEVRELLAKIDS